MSDDRLADSVGRRLAAWPRQRITLVEVEDVVVSERPELNASVHLGRRLAEVVDALVSQGVVQPTQRWVTFRGVRLPASLRRPVGPRSRRERPALRHPWREDLRWAAHTAGATFQQLRELDRWLTKNPDSPPAPVKERSLEIWGDEKLLERLLRGPLRGRRIDGLRLEIVHPPLVIERISEARGGLVVENATTWRSLVTVGREHLSAGAATSIGWIAYGAGNQVAAAVPGLAAREPTSLWYFGDLDAKGLAFAAAAAQVARSEGMPAVLPHRWLYEALLDIGQPQSRRSTWSWQETGLAWLGSELGRRVTLELSNSWLAQEWVSARVLRAEVTWLEP